MTYIFDYAELCYLLTEAGNDAPVGVDAQFFPPLSDVERQTLLQTGQAKLRERADSDGQGLVQVLVEATAVLHATRIEENEPDSNRWFFYTSTHTVQLQKVNAAQYELTTLDGATAVLPQIQQFLPLQPAPAGLTYRVKLPHEDFLTLRDLATEWEEVPALEILEADGLEIVAARDLFDSAVEPEWRGIINCLTIEGQAVMEEATLRVLQGAEISWVIRPSTDTDLIVETAQPGYFEKSLTELWQAATAR